ncbi:MAG TPA: hypothetical protein VH281_03990 [Gaiellaceae bacterium]|jgi:hypothetical protein
MEKSTSPELVQARNDRTFNGLWAVGSEEGLFACECGRMDCDHQLELALVEYAAREDGDLLLAPGHAPAVALVIGESRRSGDREVA